jgi:tetratricopeptide (TPR) repeat protein
MKLGKLLFGILFLIGLTVSAQEDECTRWKAIAGNAYKVKNYPKVTMAYVNAQNECEQLGMVFYNPFLYSIKQAMKSAATDEEKAAYLDTLIDTYEKAQKIHGDQKDWKAYQGYYYLKQGKPGNMKKADEAFQIGIHHEGKDVNKGLLQQYYANLYNLWTQEKDEEKKAEYKKRLIEEYFALSEYASKGEMGSKINDFLSVYMEKAVTDCESVLPEIRSFMGDLPQDVETKKATVNNFMALLEKKGCTKSDEYAMCVDTIIKIDPSVDAKLAKAKLQMAKGETSAAIETFKGAIEMTDDADKKSDIEYEIAVAYLRIGSYKAAHSAGLNVSGKNSGKGYEVAAKAVNKSMNSCGVSTFDRKANNYYAVELAQKSGNSALVNSFKSQCPTGTDIFNVNKQVGGKVELNCWNKTVTIEKFD